MTTAAIIVSKLQLDSSEFESGIKGANKTADTFDKKMKSIGKDMQKFGAGMTVGLTLPIVAFGASAVHSAMESESALAELNAVITSTGGAAGMTSDEVLALSSAFQKVTKFSDEVVTDGQSMLLTFTNIGEDVFPKATETMLNMAEKFGGVDQAAIQLGKALNDPVAGIGALQRVGVTFSAAQEQQIKDFMAVNDIASAQGVILAELEKEFGGLALAAGATSEGQMAQFMNQLDDMKEIIGIAIIPVLIRFMEAITPLIMKFSEASPATQNMIIGFLALVAAAGPLISILGTLITVVGAFGTGGALAGVATFFTATLLPAFSAFFTFITAVAIPAIGAFIIANAAWIVPLLLIIGVVALLYYAFKNNFMGITTTVQQLGFIIKHVFDGIMTKIGELIKKILELAAKLLGIKLPPALTPGSPTPFEMGLRGITSAMDTLSTKSLPKLQTGFGVTQGITSAGRQNSGSDTVNKEGSTIIINNPVTETSSKSISRTMRNLSYLGVES